MTTSYILTVHSRHEVFLLLLQKNKEAALDRCEEKMHIKFCEETCWKMPTDKEAAEVHFRGRVMRMESELIALCIVSSGTLQHEQPKFQHMALRGQCASKGSHHCTRLTENIVHHQELYWLFFVNSTAFIRNDTVFCITTQYYLFNPDFLLTRNVLYMAFVTFVFVSFVSIHLCIYVCMNVRTYVRMDVFAYYRIFR